MPLAEKIMWSALRNDRLGVKFRRQHSFFNFIVDFYASEIKLAVEIDGLSHESDQEKNYDAYRQAKIETLGVRFVRFTNQEVINDAGIVMERLLRIIDEMKAT